MPRKATGWSTTSFRDSDVNGGYVEGTDGYVPPSNTSTAYSSTSLRSSDNYFPSQNNPSFGGGYPNSATMRDSFDNRFDNFSTHTATGFSGTSTRSSFDSFDSQRNSSGSALSNIGTSIMDGISSTFGAKHTDVGFAGTSTRSSSTFDPDDNSNFSGTSFR